MDHLGYRLKIGAIGPSTNTIVQPDFDAMRPAGVTNHFGRILIPNDPVDNDDDFVAMVRNIEQGTLDAIDSLHSCGMQYLAMGMSVATFWDGRKAASGYLERMRQRAGVDVSCGSFAVEAALNRYGVRRIAFLSPYFPVANAHVRRFFEDCGFDVVRDICLRCPGPMLIAHTTDAQCRDALKALDGDDVDALVQVGTNLSMVRMAAAAELYLGKPVIAINTATYWHALRAAGINDKVDGFGSLLMAH